MSDKGKGVAALIIGKLAKAKSKTDDSAVEDKEQRFDDAAAEQAMADFRKALTDEDDSGMVAAMRAFEESCDSEVSED